MRKKMVLVGGIAIIILSAAFVIGRFAVAGPVVRVGQPCQERQRPSLAQVDHGIYDALLKKYVDNKGMVAYAEWKANAGDLNALDAYLAKLGCVDLKRPAPKAAALAFWINAYNAVTLKGILREYPTSSIRNHTSRLGGYNIWKDLHLWVEGKTYSLDDIEHKILRKMGEPRIHFAVVCASKGCPPLVNQAYTASNLNTLLAFNARRFFSQSSNFHVNAARRTVYISKLLKWYGTDFASSPQQQIRLLLPYFPQSQNLAWINNSPVTIRYLSYDWSLNDQNPQSN